MDSREPIDFQEVHSPTVLVENVVSHQGKLTKKAYRQRRADHRLWNGMTPDEQRAFVEIDRARGLILDGVTVRSQSFERRDPGRVNYDESDAYRTILFKTFDRWAALVLSDDEMDYHAAIAVICEGKGVNQVDREKRRRKRWARRNLGLTLELWCDLRGWT